MAQAPLIGKGLGFKETSPDFIDLYLQEPGHDLKESAYAGGALVIHDKIGDINWTLAQAKHP